MAVPNAVLTLLTSASGRRHWRGPALASLMRHPRAQTNADGIAARSPCAQWCRSDLMSAQCSSNQRGSGFSNDGSTSASLHHQSGTRPGLWVNLRQPGHHSHQLPQLRTLLLKKKYRTHAPQNGHLTLPCRSNCHTRSITRFQADASSSEGSRQSCPSAWLNCSPWNRNTVEVVVGDVRRRGLRARCG